VLLATATPADPGAAQSLDIAKLQIAAFEAINDMVRASSHDTLDIVSQLIPSFLSEITKTFSMSMQSAEAREKQGELQGQLCGVLTVRARPRAPPARQLPPPLSSAGAGTCCQLSWLLRALWCRWAMPPRPAPPRGSGPLLRHPL
jgi:hypothetical protein